MTLELWRPGKICKKKKCELYQQNPDEKQGEKLKAGKEMLENVNVDIADKDVNEVIDEIVSMTTNIIKKQVGNSQTKCLDARTLGQQGYNAKM